MTAVVAKGDSILEFGKFVGLWVSHVEDCVLK